MSGAPWYLPDNWLVVGLAILSGAMWSQIWKLHRRTRTHTKPPRYQVAVVNCAVTATLLALFGWLDDQSAKHAIRIALMWGAPAPLLWLGVQEGVVKWAPWLAGAVGASRREGARRDGAWSEVHRAHYRRECGLFGDTVEISDGVKQVKAAKRGEKP